MALDIASLIDLAVTTAEVEHGRRLGHTPNSIAAVGHVALKPGRTKAPPWSVEEEDFLRSALGHLSQEEIALRLGRSVVGVHLHWERDMGLDAPSKAPNVITAQKAGQALGVDGHKPAMWVDAGLLPGRLMPGDRKIRLIDWEVFKRWVCNPNNWVYFDIKGVQDPELRRLLQLRAKRWGDEWWTTRQVAKYHGVAVSDVKRYIQLGRISAYQPAVSRGGRHLNRAWKLWFVRRSEATRPDLKFVRRGDDMTKLTARGKAWLKTAMEKGMNFAAISRSMKVSRETAHNWAKRNFPDLEKRLRNNKAPMKGKKVFERRKG